MSLVVCRTNHGGGGGVTPSPAPVPRSCGLRRVDLDLPGLDLLDLRETDGQDAVAIAGLDLVGLHGHRQGKTPLELAVPALAPVVVVLLHLLVPVPLAADRHHVAGDREVDVLL